MNRHEEWNDLLNCLQENALKHYQTTPEYELRKARQELIDDMLYCELMDDQQKVIEEIIGELLSFQAREADLLYRQGIKDGIWMLKSLGVLA